MPDCACNQLTLAYCTSLNSWIHRPLLARPQLGLPNECLLTLLTWCIALLQEQQQDQLPVSWQMHPVPAAMANVAAQVVKPVAVLAAQTLHGHAAPLDSPVSVKASTIGSA